MTETETTRPSTSDRLRVLKPRRAVWAIWVVIAGAACGMAVATSVRVLIGPDPDDPARVLVATVVGIVPLVWTAIVTSTRIEIRGNLVRVVGLRGTIEVRRSAIVDVANSRDPKGPPQLVLAKGTQVLRSTRQRPNGREEPSEAITIRGFLPDDVKEALGWEVQRHHSDYPPLKERFWHDGRPGPFTYVFAGAIVFCIVVAIWGTSGGTGPFAESSP